MLKNATKSKWFPWLAVTSNTSKFVYRLETYSVKVWWWYVLPNTNVDRITTDRYFLFGSRIFLSGIRKNSRNIGWLKSKPKDIKSVSIYEQTWYVGYLLNINLWQPCNTRGKLKAQMSKHEYNFFSKCIKMETTKYALNI